MASLVPSGLLLILFETTSPTSGQLPVIGALKIESDTLAYQY